MKNFTVPKKEEVAAGNQAIFEHLESALGFVPNLYAYFAHNETALADYMTLQNRKTTLTGKEREVINLVVSQVNNCEYCLAAHTVIGKLNGFSDEQVLQIRTGNVPFDSKLDALVKFVKETAVNRGNPTEQATDALFAAGYNQANLVDIVINIGDKITSNYLNSITRIPLDFPAAIQLEASEV